jgi:gas vesicle protein
MKAFLAGLGIGVGLGILFAPMSGEETRNNLTQRATDLNDRARDFASRGRDQVNRGVQAARDIADRFGATGTDTGRSNAGATGTEGV